MDIENIQTNNAETLTCPPDKSPIFYVNLKGTIKDKVNSKKTRDYTAKKVVVKGTLEQIKEGLQTKKQFIRAFFKDDSASKKKVAGFDLSKIEIKEVEIIRGLGYGVKSN